MSATFLNLDRSLPVADAFHAGNRAGTLRYIDARDTFTLPAFQRIFGDIAHRFHLVEDAINAVVADIRTNPAFQSFDASVYPRADGTRGFDAPVPGQSPTIAAHLATKSYVDGQDQNTLAAVGILQTTFNNYLAATTRPFASAWTEVVWHAGQKDHLILPLVIPPGVSPNFASTASVSIVERLDIAQPTTGNPNPDPIYRYQTLAVGQAVGFRLDAVWLNPSTSAVHVLIPNIQVMPAYPGVPEWGALSVPRSRYFKAVVQAPVV